MRLVIRAIVFFLAFDNNKWTMALGDDDGARAKRGDFSLIYGYLEQELMSDKHFDVIGLQTSHGWETLTPRSREAIPRRVHEGCGLVWVRPFASELSPLVPEQPVEAPRRPCTAIEPGETEASRCCRDVAYPRARRGQRHVIVPRLIRTHRKCGTHRHFTLLSRLF